MAGAVKNQKIRCFFAESYLQKPNKMLVRHFIHSKQSGGFWAHIRDLSQRERLANEAVGHEVAISVQMGYNPAVLQLWESLIIIDERGVTYKMKEKPDEYAYDKGDIKFTAYAFRDKNTYEEDIYEQHYSC